MKSAVQVFLTVSVLGVFHSNLAIAETPQWALKQLQSQTAIALADATKALASPVKGHDIDARNHVAMECGTTSASTFFFSPEENSYLVDPVVRAGLLPAGYLEDQNEVLNAYAAFKADVCDQISPEFGNRIKRDKVVVASIDTEFNQIILALKKLDALLR